MGTRADFWIIYTDKSWEYLGSVGMDGHDWNFKKYFQIKTVEEWRNQIVEMLKNRNDATFAENGWPWPWEYTTGSDFTYVFLEANLKPYIFCGWNRDKHGVLVDPLVEWDLECPNMKSVTNLAKGNASGLMVLSMTKSGMQFNDEQQEPKSAEKAFQMRFKKCPFCEEFESQCICLQEFGEKITDPNEQRKILDHIAFESDLKESKTAWSFNQKYIFKAFRQNPNDPITIFKKIMTASERESLKHRYPQDFKNQSLKNGLWFQ